MRRVLVGLAAACFAVGTVCLGVFCVQVVRVMINMPGLDWDVERDLERAWRVQRWGWYFLGLYVVGFVILFLLRDRAETSSAKPGAPAEAARQALRSS